MSDNTPTTFLPGKNERRSFGGNPRSSADVHSLIQIFDDPRSRAPIAQAQSRQYLISVLDRQYEVSLERGYPLCLALATLDPSGETSCPAPAAILNTVAKICRSNLRPTDLLFRYADGLLAMVLLESDEDGGASVASRLKRSLDRRLYFGKTALSVRPVFAVSDVTMGFGSAGKSLLTSAELVLNKASYESFDVAVASVTLSVPTLDVAVRAQDIANAITGMFDTTA
jgi:GGDEF domain-containing protein